MSEASRHSFSKEAKGYSYEWIINHRLSESFKAADSFTNETQLFLGDAVQFCCGFHWNCYYFILKYNKQLWQYCFKNVGYI